MLPLRAEAQPREELAVVREQCRSMAEELLMQFDDNSVRGYSLHVDSGRLANIVENAFLEALNRRGKRMWLARDTRGTGDVLLHVVVLSQSVDYEPLFGGMFNRRIETSLEARFEEPDSGEVHYGGIMNRSDVDTVKQKGGGLSDLQPSVLERIVEPVVVIAGAIVIVYLLFTVRS